MNVTSLALQVPETRSMIVLILFHSFVTQPFSDQYTVLQVDSSLLWHNNSDPKSTAPRSPASSRPVSLSSPGKHPEGSRLAVPDVEQTSYISSALPGDFAGISSEQSHGPISDVPASKSWKEQQQGMQQEGHPQTTPMQGRQSVAAHTAYSITDSGRKRHRQSSMMADCAAEALGPHYGGALRQTAPSAEQPEPLGHTGWSHHGMDLRSTDVEGGWGDTAVAELPSTGSSLADKHASPLSEHSGRAAAAAARAVSRVMALQAERSRLHTAIQVCGCVMHILVGEPHARRFITCKDRSISNPLHSTLQVHTSAGQLCGPPEQRHGHIICVVETFSLSETLQFRE